MARDVERQGLGYVMRLHELGTEITVEHLVRSRGDLYGELVVTSSMPGTKSQDGLLHQARVNLSSTTSRRTVAAYVADRAASDADIWKDVLETFCARVLRAEREGEPFVVVGRRPQRLELGMRLAPILPAGKTTILFGDGGAGKSTIAQAIAVSVKTGEEVIPGFAPQSANVLYLDWETDADDVDARVKAISEGAGIRDVPEFHYRACVGSFVDQVEDVVRLVSKEHIGLVFIDSVEMASAATRGDGGDANESAIRLFSALRHLRTTVLAVDHVAKTGADAKEGAGKPYGSTFKGNLARNTFELRQAKDAEGDRIHVALYHRKSNVMRRMHPLGLWVEHSGGAIRFGREDISDVGLAAGMTLADRIAAVIAGGAAQLDDIAAELDEPANKVRAVLSRGKDSRFRKLPSGAWGLAGHAA
jgi:hypothetical protein